MNTIKKLKDNITRFLTEIASYYGIPKSEIVSTLREINFYSLYQTLCREAMPIHVFRAYGETERHQPYWGDKLFPCNAINLYREADLIAGDDSMETIHFMEVWLREDLTLAITSCFHVVNKTAGYCTSYRVHKGSEWPFEEDTFDFEAFVDGLFEAAPGIAEGQPFFEP
ncbi:MAG: hypothetical protein IJN67_15015 [Oscillospiraceae bacterium]|nr:hypothetical protein [Oscillospiraceae bacterium]MBQ7002323.1 hypothetical protein [Oscillospiraceae bacterium]